jgi:hypothetical protein
VTIDALFDVWEGYLLDPATKSGRHLPRSGGIFFIFKSRGILRAPTCRGRLVARAVKPQWQAKAVRDFG